MHLTSEPMPGRSWPLPPSAVSSMITDTAPHARPAVRMSVAAATAVPPVASGTSSMSSTRRPVRSRPSADLQRRAAVFEVVGDGVDGWRQFALLADRQHTDTQFTGDGTAKQESTGIDAADEVDIGAAMCQGGDDRGEGARFGETGVDPELDTRPGKSATSRVGCDGRTRLIECVMRCAAGRPVIRGGHGRTAPRPAASGTSAERLIR